MNESSLHIEATPRVRDTIARAWQVAESFGDNFIGVEHLLLAISRDSESVAAIVLEQLGIDLRRLESALIDVMSSEAYRSEPEASCFELDPSVTAAELDERGDLGFSRVEIRLIR